MFDRVKSVKHNPIHYFQRTPAQILLLESRGFYTIRNTPQIDSFNTIHIKKNW